MFYRAIHRIFKHLRRRYRSFEKPLQLIFFIIGLILSIVLVVTGVVAIPFTGGASLLPLWLGALIFIAIFSTTFLAAGRMLGIMIDTIIDIIKSRNLNNEKIATAIACFVALLLAAIAWPLQFIYVPFIGASAIPFWELFLIFVPWMISTIGAIGRHIGRVLDVIVRKGNMGSLVNGIFDVIGKVVSSFRKEEQVVKFESNVFEELFTVASAVENAKKGIQAYQDFGGSHLNFMLRFVGSDTGTKRAAMYLWLLENNTRVTHDLQKAIILYTMLAYSDGPTLKEKITEKMGDKAVEQLKEYIESNVKEDDREFLQERIIHKLSLFANDGRGIFKKPKSQKESNTEKNGSDRKSVKDDLDEILNNLNSPRFCL